MIRRFIAWMMNRRVVKIKSDFGWFTRLELRKDDRSWVRFPYSGGTVWIGDESEGKITHYWCSRYETLYDYQKNRPVPEWDGVV